jgi:hypothetical protein
MGCSVETNSQKFDRVQEHEHVGARMEHRRLNGPDPSEQRGDSQHVHHANSPDDILCDRSEHPARERSGLHDCRQIVVRSSARRVGVKSSVEMMWSLRRDAALRGRIMMCWHRSSAIGEQPLVQNRQQERCQDGGAEGSRFSSSELPHKSYNVAAALSLREAQIS